VKRILYKLHEIRIEPAGVKATALFESCGVRPEEIVFFEAQGKTEAAFFTPNAGTAGRVRAQYRRRRVPGMRLKIRTLQKEDWFDKWQLDYRIMPLGRKFTLVPFWQKKEFKGGRLPIFLEPKGAFGSGQHPATRIMTSFVEAAGHPDSMLDLGTGTGILSVAAFRLGAKKILALDHDPVAVRAAKYNFRLNGLESAEVRREDVTRLRPEEKYGLVCANLFTDLLEKIRPFLFGSVKPGGFLAISGVHFQNYAAFRKNFRHPDFRCLKIVRSRGWAGMLFKRRLPRR
jgi:ribosomal protein L11 methyltransferase